MSWIPVFLLLFKLTVFFTGMFFAIKWHHDQGKKHKKKQVQAPVPSQSPKALTGGEVQADQTSFPGS